MKIEKTKAKENRREPTVEEQRGAAKGMGYIGGVLCLIYLMTIIYPIYKNSKTIAVDGTVVSVIGKKGSRSNSFDSALTRHRAASAQYWHEFRFEDQQGVEHTSRSEGWFGFNSAHDIGSTVSIGYYPDNFAVVRDFSWFKIWRSQTILLFFGLLLLGYTFGMLRQLAAKEEKVRTDLH